MEDVLEEMTKLREGGSDIRSDIFRHQRFMYHHWLFAGFADSANFAGFAGFADYANFADFFLLRILLRGF